MQNHAERFRNYLKSSILDPKHAKLNQNSDFGHVRTYSSLNKWGWGKPQAGTGGTLEGHRLSQPFKVLYKNPLEIPKGIPSQRIFHFPLGIS